MTDIPIADDTADAILSQDGLDVADRPITSSFEATMMAEGAWTLTPYRESEENWLAAFQYLVNDGTVWKLQGWFGRTATGLIEAGLVEPYNARDLTDDKLTPTEQEAQNKGAW